jgi:hypothetical protein
MENGNIPFVPVILGDDDTNLKLSHDRYHVFINGDFVGNKVILAQNEDVQDLGSYLQREGFHDFTTKLDGDHFMIEMFGSEQSETAKQQLNTYLKIR